MEKLADLRNVIRELRERLSEAEETLDAIRCGEVDALAVCGRDGDQIFTLQGAEMPYRILVEEMNQGALMLVPDGTILYANTRFALLAKTPLEQVIGSSWQRFFPSDQFQRLDTFLKGAGPASLSEEWSFQAADGSCCPVQMSLRSTSASGVEGFSVIVTDLTERKNSENALRQTAEELLERNEELKTFSYSLSHDMRQPLRAMQQYAEILLEDYSDKLEADPRLYLERIVASGNRLDRLIQDVLAYSQLSRVENGKATIDLDKLVREVVGAFPCRGDADIEIIGSSSQVRGNKAALGQVIANLLANAIKFVPPGATPRVKIWAEEKGPANEVSKAEGLGPESGARRGSIHEPREPSSKSIRLWVQDNGIGIRPEDQEKVFDIFFSGHSKEVYEGTGIGLSIVKKAVEKMGGEVGVESILGQGSRFWIELKRA